MANSTIKGYKSVHGTDPQNLIEKITRERIFESKYWKEECFALTAELVVDKAIELKYVGCTFGQNIQATPFLCLVLKLLQLQPDKDIIVEFISQNDYKYVRALGAVYMRLTGTSSDCFNYLEPLYGDFKKLKKRTPDGSFSIFHMDEFIDLLLREDNLFGLILPRIAKRHELENRNELEPRTMMNEGPSDDEVETDNEEKEEPEVIRKRSVSPRKGRSRSRSGNRRRMQSRSKSRERNKENKRDRRRSRSRDDSRDRRRKDKERDRDEDRKRHRDRSMERHRNRNRDRSRERRRDDDRSRERRRHREKQRDKDRHRSRSRDRKDDKRRSKRSRS